MKSSIFFIDYYDKTRATSYCDIVNNEEDIKPRIIELIEDGYSNVRYIDKDSKKRIELRMLYICYTSKNTKKRLKLVVSEWSDSNDYLKYIEDLKKNNENIKVHIYNYEKYRNKESYFRKILNKLQYGVIYV